MTDDSTLPHATDDCAADFQLDGKRGAGVWRCQCGAEYPSTPDNDRMADKEFALGALMRNQVRRHRLRHIFERRPDPPPIIDLTPPDEPREPWQE